MFERFMSSGCVMVQPYNSFERVHIESINVVNIHIVNIHIVKHQLRRINRPRCSKMIIQDL